jgi:hypothetical protein
MEQVMVMELHQQDLQVMAVIQLIPLANQEAILKNLGQ